MLEPSGVFTRATIGGELIVDRASGGAWGCSGAPAWGLLPFCSFDTLSHSIPAGIVRSSQRAQQVSVPTPAQILTLARQRAGRERRDHGLWTLFRIHGAQATVAVSTTTSPEIPGRRIREFPTSL